MPALRYSVDLRSTNIFTVWNQPDCRRTLWWVCWAFLYDIKIPDSAAPWRQ